MKEDALEKGLPVPDEAVVRDRVLRQVVEAPDLATIKGLLPVSRVHGSGHDRGTDDLRLTGCGCGVVLRRLNAFFTGGLRYEVRFPTAGL